MKRDTMKAVFRIRDILGTDPDPWICTFDPAPDPALFFSNFRDANKKCNFFQRLKLVRKSLNSRNQGFSYFFLLDDGRIRIRTSKKRSDPTDLERWMKLKGFLLFSIRYGTCINVTVTH
jgi:hypothetical protein